MADNEKRSARKVLKNIVVSILLLFLIFTYFQQKQEINRLENTLSAAEFRLTNFYSFYPIIHGFQLVKEEPTKERFELLHASLQNQHQFIQVY
ncbi:hypothetical protein DS745_02440 [Anaerobacillus alkaliphilus]|uniref:Sensor histidine kinase n=2 Tax=Anaerobacillus alkaliphilus TaxID=1548597 RepID=A0A4Q0VXX8_9BACI|nr:hypothetical protein DS745_02440 [Anaerobacillus alkaliphilus]